MEAFLVRFASRGRYIAYLETHLDAKLDDIRKRLQNECSDLLPVHFSFLFKNIKISVIQESKLSVRQCAELKILKSKVVYNMSLLLEDTVDSNDANQKSTALHTEINLSVPDETKLQSARLSRCRQSDTENISDVQDLGPAASAGQTGNSNRKNKIDTYSRNDIETQNSWMEKEMMIFWNTKAESLQVSSETVHFKKQELIGVLEVSWAFQKADLLKIRIAKVKIRQERCMSVFNEKYDKFENHVDVLYISMQIDKHEEEVSKLLHEIHVKHERILDLRQSNISKDSKEITDTENEIHILLHQLKCTTDYLYKALCVQENRLDNFEERYINCVDTENPPLLNTQEMEELALNILHTEHEMA
ncbi:Hypothetical predicted protein [Paramuricea clavata]|uniref:Uncharacterized protein n=1 Tax=Paramuricea clavata TaxID=317549 RepID=A0A7D9DXZ6_PARCT|nr:Hypothetical predicted protein [Paramuricea clavata]